MHIVDTLAKLAEGHRLNAHEAQSLFDLILSGNADDAQIGAILGILRVRGVSDEELLGGARSMRQHAIKVPTDGIQGVVLDTCGTGGAPKTFNVSTIAALVVAAAAPGRVSVAKHGNRSRTGRGSAEVLERLGVNINAGVEVQAKCLRECGVCFCFAIQHHPAAKYAAQARRSLAFATIFNLLGPLCNPANATHQVMGVFSPQFVEPMARTLCTLGSTSAVVLHGHGGLDEFATTGPTSAAWVQGGTTRVEQIDAADAGVPRAAATDLIAPDLDAGVRIAMDVLRGIPGPCADMVTAAAGLSLKVCGVAADLPTGIAIAKEAVGRGDAERTLASLSRLSHLRP